MKTLKKIIATTLLLTTILFSETCFAQRRSSSPSTNSGRVTIVEPVETKAQAVVSGVWDRRGAEVILFRVVLGRLEKVATYSLQPNDRTFGFAFTPTTEGFYVIGTERPSRQDNYTFYFKPGDRLNVIINDTSYTLVGRNTEENIALKTWHDLTQPLERRAFYHSNVLNDEQFFSLISELAAQRFFLTPTNNNVFNEAFSKYREFDLIHFATAFSMLPRAVGTSLDREAYPNYFRTIKLENVLNNTDVLMFPYQLLSGINYLENFLKGERSIEAEEMLNLAKNDTLKGEIYLAQLLPRVRQLAALQALNEKYERYILTPDQRMRFNREIERVNRRHLEQQQQNQNQEKIPGLPFTYVDVNGNKVSFSDLKGKFVYVDVWATWCGPCRAEIPHKKRVKEHFKNNNNIVFVGISTDVPRDFEKWKEFVKTNDLCGIQLWGGMDGPENFGRMYGVRGIPRFMLFDKQGNIISTDAPRPSSPDLIPMLTKLLQ